MRRVSDRDARNVPEGERCRPNYALSRARDAGNAPPGNRGAVGYPSNSRPALSGPLGPRNRRRRVRTHPLSLQTVVRTRIPKKIPKRKAPPPGTRAALGPLRTIGCRREADRTEGSRRFVSDARDVLARATVSTFPTAVPRLNELELLPGKIRVYFAFFHGHAVTSGVWRPRSYQPECQVSR